VKNESRNTFLTIGIILLICIVAIFAILNIVWDLVQPITQSISSKFSEEIQVRFNHPDYNFPVPEIKNEGNTMSYREILAVLESSVEAKDIDLKNKTEAGKNSVDYNFLIPNLSVNNFAKVTKNNDENIDLVDPVWNDIIKITKDLEDVYDDQVSMYIHIPKLEIELPVVKESGDMSLLDEAFFWHPYSYELGEGEVVLLCYNKTRLFASSSCHKMNLLSNGDEIVVDVLEKQIYYSVVGINVFDIDDSILYSANKDIDYLKIISSDPRSPIGKRIVILAKKNDFYL
jgi:LPXTG-site transpeptidase (sortase) family protein